MKMYKSLDHKLGYAESAYELGILAYDMNDHEKFENWFDEAIESCNAIGLSQRIHAIEDERYQLLTQDQVKTISING
jgi:hypothetical protein